MPSLLPTHSSAPGDKTVFIKGTVLAILWTFNNGAGGRLIGSGQDSSQDGERKRVDPIHSQLELYLKFWGLVGPNCLGKQEG